MFLFDIETHPESQIFLVGISLGASILTRYLGEEGSNSKVQAAGAVCCPYSVPLSCHYLHKGVGLIYCKVLAGHLLKKYETWAYDIENIDSDLSGRMLKAIKTAKTIRDIDELICAREFGYSNVDDFWEGTSPEPFIEKVKTPTLFLSTRDDPIINKVVIPYKEMEKNPNTCLAVTKAGGHVGFIDIMGNQWHQKPLLEFFKHFR